MAVQWACLHFQVLGGCHTEFPLLPLTEIPQVFFLSVKNELIGFNKK